ncbi:phage tail assembly chaperone G [Brevibacillus borstelensis]|uniref:phage tail assembly chaperone G n=1 Tax=Brevibacillus borstelensis TaxID=45462 RepID=UPI0030C4DD6C
MELTLIVDGKEKTFVAPFISGRMFRRTLEFQKKFKGDIDETTLDTAVDYVVELYGKQFDRDTFYDGIESKKLLSTITGCIDEVVDSVNGAIGDGGEAPNE